MAEDKHEYARPRGLDIMTSDLLQKIQDNHGNKDFLIDRLLESLDKVFSRVDHLPPQLTQQRRICSFPRKIASCSILDDWNKCEENVAVHSILIIATIVENFQVFWFSRKERWEIVREMYKLAKSFSQLKDFSILNHLHMEAGQVLSTIVEASSTYFFYRRQKNCDRLVLYERNINGILRRIKGAQRDLAIEMLVHILRDKQQVLFGDADGTRGGYQRPSFEKEEEEREKQVREIIKLLRLKILEKKRVAVVILGDSGESMTKLADAVNDRLEVKLSFEGWKLFPKRLTKSGELKLNVQELQLEIQKMRNDQHFFICIENMVQVQNLRRILDMKSLHRKTVRMLVTSPNKGVKELLKEYKFTCEEYICIEDKRDDYSQYPLLGEMLETYQKIANEANKETLSKRVDEDNLIDESFMFALEHAFKNLPSRARDAFLDICSFFTGWDWDEISLIVGKPELETLEADGWVKRNRANKLSIPNQALKWFLETRETECGRITSTKELQSVLDREENTAQIEGIWLASANETVEIPAEKLELMCDTLRVLSLGRTTVVKGNCNKPFQKLIFLEVCGTSISFVNLKELRNLSYLSYDRDEDFDPSQLPPEMKVVKLCGDEKFKYPVEPKEKECIAKKLENLSTIKVKKFQRLHILDPKIFRPNDSLKELSVSSCSVVELPKTLTQLYALQKLDLHDCKNLLILPNSFGCLLCLTRLDLSYCSSLKRLPESFGKLQCLEEVILRFCSTLKQVPASFVHLAKLKKVTFSHCHNMQKLPDKFELLRSLEELDFSYCKSLKFLPVHFELLSSLQLLNLDGCSKLEKLPDNFPESLFNSESVAFKLSGCSNLTELQDEFCQGNKIKDLSLASCNYLERLPRQINELTQLRYLNLSDCQSLRKLPNTFSGLRFLEGLNLSSCQKLRDLCEDFDRLQSLKYLNLSDCPILEAKCLAAVKIIKSLAFVDIRKSQKLVEKCRKQRLALPNHFRMIMEEKPEDKENNEQKILRKTSSKFFKDKAILVSKDGSSFFPSKRIPELEGNTLVLIFYHNISHWNREMLENNVDELLTNLTDCQIIYIGKSFSELPPKLAERIIAYTPDNPEALSFFDKCLSINANTDFWSFNINIIKTKVEEQRFKQWESISGTLTGKNFSLHKYQKLQYTEESNGVDFLEALVGTKEEDRLMSKGNKKVSINDLKKNIIFLLISTLEISKSQMAFLKEMYDEMRNTEHDLKVEWVWFAIPDADKDMPISNDCTDIPWVVISYKWLMEQSTVTKILREKVGFCEMPILVSLAASGRISVANVMPLLATQGSEACLLLNKVMPRKLSKKDHDKLDMMKKQFHLNFLFKDFPMDTEKKLSSSQMIWLYGGNPQKISDFNSKLSRLRKSMDRNCKIQIMYVGRGRFLHDINSIKEEEDLHKKNIDGIDWLSLSIKDMKKFWHRMHYLVYLIASQIEGGKKKVAFNNEEEAKKLKSQKEDEVKKLDSLRRLVLGLLSFDCLSRRNDTVWMIAIDGANNGIFTGRGKELVDLLSANIEKNINSSINIESGVVEVYSRKRFLKGGLIKVEKSSEDSAAKMTFKDAPWFVVHPPSQVEEQISASMSCSICYFGDPVYHCDTCDYFGICEKCYAIEFVGNIEVTTH